MACDIGYYSSSKCNFGMHFFLYEILSSFTARLLLLRCKNILVYIETVQLVLILFLKMLAVHEILGLQGFKYQSLYHFTIGGPVVDKRIMSLPAYPGPSNDA